MRLTLTAKVVLALFIVGCMAIGIHLQRPGLFGQMWHVIFVPEQIGTSKVPRSAPLPNVPDVQASGAATVSLPGTEPGCVDLPEVRVQVWAWNAQMGLMLANGGHMPALPSALRGAGLHFTKNRNSAELASPHLSWLVDRWAAPSWIPWANVFSVGDILIATGGLLFALGATGVLRLPSRRQPPEYATATR